jgi:O-antigen/teichoic acid export membrane protein
MCGRRRHEVRAKRVTMVTGRPGSGEGVAVRDDREPSPAAPRQVTTENDAAGTAQVKDDARQAARALHDAIADIDARGIERSVAGRALVAVNGHRYDPEPILEDISGQAAVAADDDNDLRTRVSQGVRWGLISSIVTQGGRFAFVVALMRLLGPENVGIVGQATVFITITYIFLNLGTTATIIQRPHLEKTEVGSAWWVNVVLGVLLAGVTVAIAPLLATFFRTEQLTAVLRVLSVCFVLKAIVVVPMALLYRDMRFRSLGVVEIGSTYLGGALAIAAAASGAAYWALVVQTLATDAIYLVALVAVGGWPELTWSVAAARRLWSFSSRVMGSELVRFISNNSDKFMVGRFLGATALGYYSLSYKVLLLPQQTMQQAGRVILPTFSRLQDDRERLAHVFLQASQCLALVVCPAMTLTILCAPLAVPAVFGEVWAPAVVPVQLLAAMTMLYLVFSITGPVVLAVGRADWEFRWSIFTVVVALISFAVGLQWGITGVAAASVIMTLALSPIRFMMVRRVIPISPWSYARSLTPAVVSSAVLSGVWLFVAMGLRGVISGFALLCFASVAGVAGYLLVLRAAWSQDLRYQLEFARQVVGRGRS